MPWGTPSKMVYIFKMLDILVSWSEECTRNYDTFTMLSCAHAVWTSQHLRLLNNWVGSCARSLAGQLSNWKLSPSPKKCDDQLEEFIKYLNHF